MRLATLVALTVCLFGAVIVSAQETEENEYDFSYQTDSSFRKEKKGADGTILGEYGFRTPDGCMHVVKFRAHTKGGYRILGSSKRDCIRKSPRQSIKAKSQRPTSTTAATTTTTGRAIQLNTRASTTTTRTPRTRKPRTRRPRTRTRTTTESPIQVSIPRPAPRILEPVDNAIDGPTTTTVYPSTRDPGSSSQTQSSNTAQSPSVPSNPTPVSPTFFPPYTTPSTNGLRSGSSSSTITTPGRTSDLPTSSNHGRTFIPSSSTPGSETIPTAPSTSASPIVATTNRLSRTRLPSAKRLTTVSRLISSSTEGPFKNTTITVIRPTIEVFTTAVTNPVTTTRRTTTTTTTTPRPRPTTPKTKTTTPKRPTFAKSLSKDEPEPSYTFGFTTSTHGHTESGLPDGSKKGEYFIDYPNGLRMIVTYVANERGFFPKITYLRTPTTTVAPPTTTPDEDEEGDAVGKQLIPTIPSGGFGCPYYFYYNTKINYHWEYCQLNGTKVGEFGELASDNYVHVNAYYADARGFHPKLSKTLMTPEQREVMAEYQTGAYILPKPDEERLATEKRIQAWMAENRERLANPLAV